jgi:hypothetical protein
VFSRRSLRRSAWLWRIENEALGRNLILTDSMSAIKAMESRKISLHTHPFVYECNQKCWQLTRSGREVSFMWVPAHVGSDYFGLYGVQCRIGCSRFISSRKTENVGRMFSQGLS